MTVYPELKDEATGLPIEGSAEVVDTRVANLAKEELNFDGQSPETYEDVTPLDQEEVDGNYSTNEKGDLLYDGFISNEDLHESELVEVSDEIHNSTVVPDEGLATAILQAPMSDSPADTTVAYLAHQVYSGNISAEEAFTEALNSGVNHAELIRSFNYLKQQLES